MRGPHACTSCRSRWARSARRSRTSAWSSPTRAYVAVSMRIMTRMGQGALDVLGEDGDFVPCLHSVGMPLADGGEDVPWPCNAENKYIVHFPETREIWSYGSGYGGNALLGKKCFALRIASVMARDEGWLAEHMLILKLTSPEGEVKLRRRRRSRRPAARPTSPCCIPTLRGLEGRDDRRRHRLDEVRRRRPALRDQPGGGLLRRGAGHRREDQPERDGHACARTRSSPTCALTDDGDVWWEGMTDEPPAHLIDWHGNDWTPGLRDARPRTRTRASPTPAGQCPSIAPSGRTPPACRSTPSCSAAAARPWCRWCTEAFDWEHGVFLGSIMGSETTAAAAGDGRRAALRPDGDAAVLRLQHGRLLRALAEDRRARPARSCRGSSSSTGSARTTTASSCGPASARTRRVLEWIFRRCDGDGRGRRDADRLRADGRVRSTSTGSTSRAEALAELLRGRPRRAGRRSCRRCASTSRSSATTLPQALREQLEALEQRLEA